MEEKYEEIDKQIEELDLLSKKVHDENIKPLYKLMKPFNKIIEKYKKEKEALLLKKVNLKKEDMKLNGPDWKALLSVNDCGNSPFRKELETYLSDLGLKTMGYFPKIKQVAIEICLNKNDDEQLKKVENGLKTILPFMIPFEDDMYDFEHEIIVFHIMEETLSQGGSYSLIINPKTNEGCVNMIRYYSSKCETPFMSLPKVLKYIQQKHYYKK